MRISDICTGHVVHCRPEASVRDAAEAMRRHHVGALVVVDEPNGERLPIGMLTDRDIVVAVVAAGVDPASLAVRDVMSGKLVTCSEQDELFDAIGLMRTHGVRRLPVLNPHGGLAGIVSADDIQAALGEHLQGLGRALTREQVREMQSRS